MGRQCNSVCKTMLTLSTSFWICLLLPLCVTLDREKIVCFQQLQEKKAAEQKVNIKGDREKIKYKTIPLKIPIHTNFKISLPKSLPYKRSCQSFETLFPNDAFVEIHKGS